MNCKGQYVIARKSGEIQTIEFVGDTNDFFKTMKEAIGCEMAEPVTLAEDPSGNQLVMVCDEEGYMRFDATERSKEANKIATRVYNGDKADPHWVLGDVVFCAMVEGGEGLEFAPFSKNGAEKVVQTLTEVKEVAESLTVPTLIGDPEVRVEGFDTIEELMEAARKGIQ